MSKRKIVILIIISSIIVLTIIAYIILFSPKYVSERMINKYCTIIRSESDNIYLACKSEAWVDWLKPLFEFKNGIWVLSETDKVLQNYTYLDVSQIKESKIPLFPVASVKFIHRDFTTQYLYKNNYIPQKGEPVGVGLIIDHKTGELEENFVAIIFREGYKEHVIEYSLGGDHNVVFSSSFFRFIVY